LLRHDGPELLLEATDSPAMPILLRIAIQDLAQDG